MALFSDELPPYERDIFWMQAQRIEDERANLEKVKRGEAIKTEKMEAEKTMRDSEREAENAEKIRITRMESTFERFKEMMGKQVCSEASNEPTPLDRANETIRKANKRINELKSKIESMDKEKLIMNARYNSLNQRVSSLLDELSLLKKRKSEPQEMSALELFGFREPQGRATIKARYRQLCAIYHPDKGGSDAMMQRINAAYHKLTKTCS